MSEPVLTPQDRQSASWLKLKERYEARLATLRAQNDSELDERKTARLRGRIAEVKAFLSLGTDTPVVLDESDKFRD